MSMQPMATTRRPVPAPRYGVPETPRRPGDVPGPGEPRDSTPSTDALAQVRAMLDEVFGGSLSAFAEQAWEWHLQGVPDAEIIRLLRQTEEYRARFVGIEQARIGGRPMTEVEYLGLERTLIQLNRQFDLPPNSKFDSPEFLGRIIGSNQSPNEYGRRLTAWQEYERSTRDPVVAEEIARRYAAEGAVPSDGDYLAVVLDPDEGVNAVERRLASARVAAESRRAGYGSLSLDTADRVTDLLTTDGNVNVGGAREGFSTLARNAPLFRPLTGEVGAETFSEDEQVGAVFAGNTEAARRIERQRRKRLAESAGGGGAASGRSGLSSVG